MGRKNAQEQVLPVGVRRLEVEGHRLAVVRHLGPRDLVVTAAASDVVVRVHDLVPRVQEVRGVNGHAVVPLRVLADEVRNAERIAADLGRRDQIGLVLNVVGDDERAANLGRVPDHSSPVLGAAVEVGVETVHVLLGAEDQDLLGLARCRTVRHPCDRGQYMRRLHLCHALLCDRGRHAHRRRARNEQQAANSQNLLCIFPPFRLRREPRRQRWSGSHAQRTGVPSFVTDEEQEVKLVGRRAACRRTLDVSPQEGRMSLEEEPGQATIGVVRAEGGRVRVQGGRSDGDRSERGHLHDRDGRDRSRGDGRADRDERPVAPAWDTNREIGLHERGRAEAAGHLVHAGRVGAALGAPR